MRFSDGLIEDLLFDSTEHYLLFKGFQLFDMCVEKNVVIRDLTVGLFQRADTAAAMGNMFASLFQV